jgi:hypothetical protein
MQSSINGIVGLLNDDRDKMKVVREYIHNKST